MRLRRRSKKSRVMSAVGTYLKFKAIQKTLRATRKGIKGLAAYKATKTMAKNAPTPVKALPVVAGVGAAGAVAARKMRHKEPAAV
jgi:hypothetical protein